MNFKEMLAMKVEGIERGIRAFLPKEEGPQKTVFQAMNYSVLAGGKRLRPMLMRETYIMFGGVNEAVLLPFMAAIEMIHTYSLIHDDLPALDNDEYRRGQKTTHVVYGEAMARLAGDALLNYAYETAARAFDEAGDDKEFHRVAKAMQILCQKPGIYGMIGGQVVDVELVGQPVDKETLDFIYAMKTSALIECSMMIGALLAGADDSSISLVESVANRVGIAFQIQDDILDVTSTLEELGKPVHSDERNDKNTYVDLVGLETAKEFVASLSKSALEDLKKIEGEWTENSFLEELICYLINRKK